MTTIYARMTSEDKAQATSAVVKVFRNSQPYVSGYPDLRAARVRNSHQFRSSVASSVHMDVRGGGEQTAS